ncbi:MAG: hypothetical protein WA231_15840, partial [Methylocella sp.]
MRFWRTANGGAIGPRTSAAIGDDIDVLDIEKGAGQLGGLFQQAHVHDLIGHGLRNDHFVLRVDGDLRVLADANLRMGGHRPAVRISERYLALAAPLQFRQKRPVAAAFLAERRDLLGKVFRARAAARSAFLDIALLEPPQIVVQPLAGRADELLQRGSREVSILVVDRLDPRPIHGQQFQSFDGVSFEPVFVADRRSARPMLKGENRFQFVPTPVTSTSFIHMRMDTRMKSSCSRSSNARDILD